MLYRKH